MDLIKKNILLFSILGITLIIVGVLAYMVLVTHSRMGEYIDKVNSLRDTIKKLGKETPRPVKDNIVRINKDIEGYKKVADDIIKLYGHPNYPALVAMCKVLNVKPDDMRNDFREFWTANNNPGIARGLVLRTYINKQKEKFGVKKWDDAMAVFQKEIEKVTYEKINDDNIKDIYFFTLGLPRVLRDVLCKKFITEMREKLLPLLLKDTILPKEVQLLTFSEAAYTNALPKWYDIPDIIFSWSIIEDIVSRLADTGIREISEFSKRGLIGYVDGQYTYYRFNLTVHGSEDSIRKFIDNLYKGYREHRVYVVREISLKRDYDMAAILLKKSAGIDFAIEDTKRNQPGMDPMGMGAPLPGEGRVETAEMRKKKQEAEEEKKLREAEELKLPFNKRKGYGDVVLGGNMQIEAEIAIDYVVYNGYKINIEQK